MPGLPRPGTGSRAEPHVRLRPRRLEPDPGLAAEAVPHRETGTTFAQANAYLTALKATDELVWLNEVSSVPLQQAIRHQQAAYAAFFAKRARYPRFKTRQGRQSAEYTRSAFRWREGRLFLAKMGTPPAFAWSWPGIDPAAVDPSTVTVSRDPCGRWYVSLAVDVPDPDPLPATGRAVGVDLGVKDVAVTSGGQRIPNPRHLEQRARNRPGTSGGRPAASPAPPTAPKPRPKPPGPTARSAPPAPTSSTRLPPAWSGIMT